MPPGRTFASRAHTGGRQDKDLVLHPDDRQPRERALHRLAAVADLAHQHASLGKMASGLPENARNDVEPVFPGRKREPGLADASLSK